MYKSQRYTNDTVTVYLQYVSASMVTMAMTLIDAIIVHLRHFVNCYHTNATATVRLLIDLPQ